MEGLLFLFGLFLALGLFFLTASVLKLPTMGAAKAMLGTVKQERKAAKTLETYLGSNLASEVIIKIDEMVVKYVNSIEAIDPIATLGTLFKAGSTIITAVLGLIFTPYVLIEAKRLVSIFDRLCSLFMSKEKIELIHDYAVRSHQMENS